jgi:hypothetical protein
MEKNHLKFGKGCQQRQKQNYYSEKQQVAAKEITCGFMWSGQWHLRITGLGEDILSFHLKKREKML